MSLRPWDRTPAGASLELSRAIAFFFCQNQTIVSEIIKKYDTCGVRTHANYVQQILSLPP